MIQEIPSKLIPELLAQMCKKYIYDSKLHILIHRIRVREILRSLYVKVLWPERGNSKGLRIENARVFGYSQLFCMAIHALE